MIQTQNLAYYLLRPAVLRQKLFEIFSKKDQLEDADIINLLSNPGLCETITQHPFKMQEDSIIRKKVVHLTTRLHNFDSEAKIIIKRSFAHKFVTADAWLYEFYKVDYKSHKLSDLSFMIYECGVPIEKLSREIVVMSQREKDTTLLASLLEVSDVQSLINFESSTSSYDMSTKKPHDKSFVMDYMHSHLEKESLIDTIKVVKPKTHTQKL